MRYGPRRRKCVPVGHVLDHDHLEHAQGHAAPHKVDLARQFYEGAVTCGRGADAAVVRVELMKRIAELQGR